MNPAIRQLALHENDARKLMLAQAVETTDMQGKLVSAVERDAIDREVSHPVRAGAEDDPAQVEALLKARAERVLEVVNNRNAALAAYQHRRPWTLWLGIAVPLAAVVLGAATDRIANPHRVDLLSLPLLTILAWNLIVYAVLLLTYVLQRDRPEKKRSAPSPVADLVQRVAGWHPRAGAVQARVMAVFSQKWHAATAALQGQRVRKVLHLAAAGWALGIVMSLFTRGLVVEYRVGWESTFLNAEQVHAIVKTLLLPVLAVFPFQSFSVQDIAAMRFDGGAATGAAAGARWVYLYASLLGMVVIAPRLLLALWAQWRAWQLAQQVTLDLDNSYYRRVIAMMHPARIQLGLIALREDDVADLLRLLQTHGQQRIDSSALAPGAPPVTLLRTSSGETLLANRLALPASAAPPLSQKAAGTGWADRALARFRPAPTTSPSRPGASVHGHAAGQPDAALILLRGADEMAAATPPWRQSGLPVLLLVKSGAAGAAQREADLALCRTRANALGLDAEVLGWHSVARCWVQQPILFEAIGRCLPAAKREGFAGLHQTLVEQNRERLAEAMGAIANQVVTAAREIETVNSVPPSITRLIKSADRQADAQARTDATRALAARLQAAAHQTQATLLRLHGLDSAAALQLDETLEAAFKHSAPINAREAGMAGAATGAATGASVDLITGGLTLGAAAAIGALVGGGAALAGAAWKNRSAGSGAATVQLSDEMLQALLESALLRYLAIVHLEGGDDALSDQEAARNWPGLLAAALAPHQAALTAMWAQARQQAQPFDSDPLAGELQVVMRELLRTLYPAAPPP